VDHHDPACGQADVGEGDAELIRRDPMRVVHECLVPAASVVSAADLGGVRGPVGLRWRRVARRQRR
jgi:hypothetical protein